MCDLSDSERIERSLDPAKFRQPEVTANGAERAWVGFERLETLWFNTGTLCNIECRRCYMDSSPANHRLSYLTATEVSRFLDEIAELELETREIGFTGGEPFLNPEFLSMLEDTLDRGFEALVLTNAMRPMMRPAVRSGLRRLRRRHDGRLHLRVSLDHHTRELHEMERGFGSWDSALGGLRWLAEEGFHVSVAGRIHWGESEGAVRRGYAGLFAAEGLPQDATDPDQLVLFPEMDAALDVPEITVDCWRSLGVEPTEMMCARSRMVVRRREAASASVVTCTLLPYDPQFELGGSVEEALGPVRLNHPHCARFCVLGGGSCSMKAL